MRRFILAVLLIAVAGCGSITGCEDKTQTIEAIYNDGFYDIELSLVDRLKKQGYDCQSVVIRNGAGTAIGDRYTCTRCA